MSNLHEGFFLDTKYVDKLFDAIGDEKQGERILRAGLRAGGIVAQKHARDVLSVNIKRKSFIYQSMWGSIGIKTRKVGPRTIRLKVNAMGNKRYPLSYYLRFFGGERKTENRYSKAKGRGYGHVKKITFFGNLNPTEIRNVMLRKMNEGYDRYIKKLKG